MLLVDDAAAIRNALRGVLEDAGIEVVGEAPDGLQGVAMTGSLRPDGVQVVVLSAYETEESARAVLAAGPSPSSPSTAAPTESGKSWSPPGGPGRATQP